MTNQKKGFSNGRGTKGTGKPTGSNQLKVKKNRGSGPGNPETLQRGGKKEKLTEQMKCFVDNYLFHYVKSEALREAGYTTNNPTSYANQLLMKPYVAAYLAERQAEIAEQNKHVH